MQRRQPGGISPFLLVVVAVGIFGAILYFNSRPAPSLRVIVPTEGQPTDSANAWEQVL